MRQRIGLVVALLLTACGDEGCPVPEGYPSARPEDFLGHDGQVCETSSVGCPGDFVDFDSRMSLVNVASRLGVVNGEGVAQDACESHAVVAGVDGSRATGRAIYEGDSEWSFTLRVTHGSAATPPRLPGLVCCYTGRLVGNPALIR